ncbi:calpain clp-1 family protein [Oesophagostomum dentatum]|uniref:Calpain clp-1 family protein n=1 Tax=Oesophagostomum dentatum TaxID=61180 RepID=A0A0B1T1B1_OESDE|nr:calpain clp-1 family protein [Oesophagostomum dentatum]
MGDDEVMQKVEVKPEEFSGLIGNIAGNLIRDRVGGPGGDILAGLAGNVLGGGGGGGRYDNNYDGGGGGGYYGGGGPPPEPPSPKKKSKGKKALNFLGELIGVKKKEKGKEKKNNVFLAGARRISIISHVYLGRDPMSDLIGGFLGGGGGGGAVAGNVIMGLGGKDNSLGNIGKVILDNIISGKFRRDVDPFVRPEPRPAPRGGGGPSPIQPVPAHEPLDFYAERDRCLAEKRLFEDPHFPAQDSSLFYSRSPPKRIEWLRPGEIVREPQLITEGHSRFDVIQGELGDCWLLAAAANLTLKDELFYRVVPPDQSFTENYAGIFHFQFWQYGKWVDVVVDDRLPTSNGELLYMHSKSHNEFWSALLEKAYAKLFGSYEALKGGTTSEALEDMTGGLTEFFDLHQPPRNLMQMMMRGFEMGSLFGCSIEADPYQWEAKLPNGLVKGHAYSITGMRIVNGPYGQTCILRVRNPWGNEQEWNGPWSDNSSEWRSIPDKEKEEMGLRFDHDGEFWMSFEDFMRNFEKMEICNLGPDVMDEVYQMTGVRAPGSVWAANTHDGAWIANQTAGGCRNYIS